MKVWATWTWQSVYGICCEPLPGPGQDRSKRLPADVGAVEEIVAGDAGNGGAGGGGGLGEGLAAACHHQHTASGGKDLSVGRFRAHMIDSN